MEHQDIGKRNLGKSEIQITPIGMGAWQFSQGKGFNGLIWSPLSEEQTNHIIETAFNNGINWFDTAEMYGKGRSEQALAAGLKQADINEGEVKIATKWWPVFRFARNIRKTIDTRMEKLDPYPIDLYQIHQPWSFSFTKSEMEAMADIADEGYIRTIGVSNFKASKMETAYEHLERRGYPLVSNQVKYSLLDREIEQNGILDKAKELDMTIIAYSPLEMGLLTGKFHDNPSLLDDRPFIRRWTLRRKIDQTQDLVDVLKQIGSEVDATASQVALNWMITYHDNVVVIPGASKPKHVEQNAKAMKIELSSEQVNAIEEKSQQYM